MRGESGVQSNDTLMQYADALATQNLSARAVTLVRCQLHELPDRAFLIRFAPSLLPAFEGAERYAQKLSGLPPGPSESKPPSAEVVCEVHQPLSSNQSPPVDPVD